MVDKPFGRRNLLRGAGALSAAALAPWPVGCAPEDDALTFFFAANPDEADARLRIVEDFRAVIPISRFGRCCPVRTSCNTFRRFAPAANVPTS